MKFIFTYFKPLLVFILAFLLILISNGYFKIGLINGITQILLFVILVCIPAYKTDRMSYVDIAWPVGLVMIAALVFVFSNGQQLRTSIIVAIYLFIGLRMSLMAIYMWKKGVFKKELPRYQYQRIIWEKQAKNRFKLAMQVEILVQALANASFLALPALLMAFNPKPNMHVIEWLGIGLWFTAYLFETVADRQKWQFLKRKKKQAKHANVCNVGLWKYSRHPNYFGQWMGWNGLILAAMPSWIYTRLTEPLLVWLMLGLMLLFVSRMMYVTLVYYTGARPAEYYSVQKRPEYIAYQKSTNQFFPGRSKP